MTTETANKDDNKKDNFDWDDVAFDPHQDALEEGRNMGKSVGEEAGFRDGRRLGQTKGIEFGMELGFIQGFVNSLDVNLHSTNDRVQRSITELQKALDDFPSPDVMFEQSEQMLLSGSTNSTDDDSESAVTKYDVVAKMQRVRARFKLLTVQLGMGAVSLKQVLVLGAGNGSQELPPSREW